MAPTVAHERRAGKLSKSPKEVSGRARIPTGHLCSSPPGRLPLKQRRKEKDGPVVPKPGGGRAGPEV